MCVPEGQPFQDPVLRSSVGQYTAGVQTAADGAHSAKDGSAQLAAGTKTLYDGVNTLERWCKPAE